MKRRHRRRLKVLRMRVLRFFRMHSVSALSAAVLALAGAVAMTSGSFELPSATLNTGAGEPAAGSPAAAAAEPPASAPAPEPARRRSAIVYLVTEDAEGQRVIDMHGSLVWDNGAWEQAGAPLVRYLVAGTPAEEVAAIQSLNYFIEVAGFRRFDFRVVDLRPGRGVAANAALP